MLFSHTRREFDYRVLWRERRCAKPVLNICIRAFSRLTPIQTRILCKILAMIHHCLRKVGVMAAGQPSIRDLRRFARQIQNSVMVSRMKVSSLLSLGLPRIAFACAVFLCGLCAVVEAKEREILVDLDYARVVKIPLALRPGNR